MDNYKHYSSSAVQMPTYPYTVPSGYGNCFVVPSSVHAMSRMSTNVSETEKSIVFF